MILDNSSFAVYKEAQPALDFGGENYKTADSVVNSEISNNHQNKHSNMQTKPLLPLANTQSQPSSIIFGDIENQPGDQLSSTKHAVIDSGIIS